MKIEAAAQVMSNFINNLSPEYAEFCQIMAKDHPTLQQSFTRLCLEWIKTMADKDQRFIDPRNEESHKVCNKIKTALSSYEGDKYWAVLPTI